ncbi:MULTISPECIES: hypothetical protein [Stenotrophomonas]|uniref:deoxynucleotide monophosphate kinase family protein n=1 Tax=Stenotrophomonas TaxID=40323 RepID=UPI000DB3D239|nr:MULTISPECIES: hypothetical protein [Stenotrophomonas]MBA0429145.1 hypothetical protein [Stenotrophomonas maltophilia]MDH0273078.1 hypothetical protein [Stenotrophomonas sp. GD04089]MDH1909927.1 hypothetical protein [Stenotrophomonas sp. GD03794]PZP86410.1 MAG: hypothetical protein DI592_04540 [Stenotrophomonas maltophilia]
MIPASLDSGHRMIVDTLAAFRASPALGSIALRAAPQARPPLYIGIAGGKRAGKDTLANGLASALVLPCDSFAAPLRQFVASLLGLSLRELDGRKEEAIDWLAEFTPRHLMQTAGTEWGRDRVHPELWVRSLFARLPAGGLVPDVRFANEAHAIRRRSGVVIRVSRPGHGSHDSEQPLPDDLVDIEVNNDGTQADLVRRTLDQLLSRGVI